MNTNNKKLLIVIILLIPFAVISFMKVGTNFNLPEDEKNRTAITVRIKLTSSDEIIENPLEEYLIGVVAAEMPALFHPEALKAQAVAARTYALSKLNNQGAYDLVDNTDNQVYINIDKMHEKWLDEFDIYYEKIKKSVEETKNLVITYDKQFIDAYYFAMSNGYTENAEMVFSEKRDYLKSVESVWDNEKLRNYTFETKILSGEFCIKLGVSCQRIDIKITDRSSTNRVNEIEVNGSVFKGTEFRKKLGLRSTDFDIEKIGNYIVIITRGYGHGVGMSQHGANGMANEGKTYIEILNYYYQNTEIIDYNSV